MIALDVITAVSRTSPHACALEMGADKLSWEAYRDQVQELLPWLAAALDCADATVVIEAPASIAVFVITSALATIGTPWIALDPGKPADVRQHQTRLLAPSLIVRQVAGAVVFDVVGTGQRLPLPNVPVGEQPALDEQRPFRAFGFTSGTTGSPKLVLRTRPSEVRRSRYMIDRFGFDATDRFLLCLPLSHASSHGWARTFLSAGATVVIGAPDAEDIADNLLHHRITASLIVPPILAEVLDHVRKLQGARRADTELAFLLTGGRHVSASLVGRTLRVLGPVLHSYYGTTETGVNAIATPIELLADPRTSGASIDGTVIRIVDRDGRCVTAGETGRVAIASYMNAERYGSGPIPTVLIDGESFTITSDTGYLTEDDELRILGRTSGDAGADSCGDLIGLEEDLRILSGVADAAAMIDPETQRVDLFIVEGAGHAGIDTPLVSYLATQLARQRGVRLPTLVHVVDRLSFNPTGKFDRAKTLAIV